jgi:hypothetical protein
MKWDLTCVVSFWYDLGMKGDEDHTRRNLATNPYYLIKIWLLTQNHWHQLSLHKSVMQSQLQDYQVDCETQSQDGPIRWKSIDRNLRALTFCQPLFYHSRIARTILGIATESDNVVTMVK